MAQFRMDVSRETGAVMLYMKSACGFRPRVGWSSMNGVREFADMLLGVYPSRNEKMNRVREVSDNIIKQVLGNGLNSLEKKQRSE